MEKFNKTSLDTLCRTLSAALGIRGARRAKPKNRELFRYIKNELGAEKLDKIVMYNPDAIAEWIYDKYRDSFRGIEAEGFVGFPMRTVMPSVTPVCFATMYTGTQPRVHGIRKYERPVITVDSLFDALIRAGKRPVILAERNSSLSMIYQNRAMDYFIFDSVEEVNEKVLELIRENRYDFYCIYNGNYDEEMHRVSPEGAEALEALRENIGAFGQIVEAVKESMADSNVLVGFAMDHGCHEIDGGLGSHGLAMAEDLNIRHLYKVYRKKSRG